VLALPFNLGIGAAVQTGYLYARDNGFELAVQIDGDGYHNPHEVARLVGPILDGQADMVVGTRFVEGGGYRGTHLRRIVIHLFAALVSLIVRQRVTDTTSGFRAVNRRGIRLFAADYPHDYPEVEATVLLSRHGLKMVEVPVVMRIRAEGSSSITTLRSVYYMVKVLLVLFVSLFAAIRKPWRRNDPTTSLRRGGCCRPHPAAVIFELIRTRRLQERYALLWLLTGLVIFVFGGLARAGRMAG
jgi:glycosyltransferase involved in cell wall biosynthesis